MAAFLLGFFLGVFTLLGYMIWRMLRSDGWDDSNILNALRVISHVTIHPEDLAVMWYLDPEGHPSRRPFDYISKDEFEDIVQSRPYR